MLAPAFDDIVTQVQALVANEHGRPGNERADFILVLATE
jgi:hypothetical protein